MSTKAPVSPVFGPPTTPAPPSEPVSWVIAFLKNLNAPLTTSNLNGVLAWGQSESGSPSSSQTYPSSSGGWANFNPLNVVAYSGSGATSQGGQQGDIANFGDLGTGAKASAQLFLTNPAAAPIVQTLRSGNGDPSTLNGAVNQFYSTWGSSINFAGITPNTTSSPGTTAGNTATTTSIISDIPIIGPIIQGEINAGQAAGTLAGAFVGLFTNWRYVVEVAAGVGLLIVGFVLILHDTGADKRISQGAVAGAVAA